MARHLSLILAVACALCTVRCIQYGVALRVRQSAPPAYPSDEGPLDERTARQDAELAAAAVNQAAATEAADKEQVATELVTVPPSADEIQAGEQQTTGVDITGFPGRVVPLGVELESDSLQEEEMEKDRQGEEAIPELASGPAQTSEPVSPAPPQMISTSPADAVTSAILAQAAQAGATPAEAEQIVKSAEAGLAAQQVQARAPSLSFRGARAAPSRQRSPVTPAAPGVSLPTARGPGTINVVVRHYFPQGVPVILHRSFLPRFYRSHRFF